MVCEIGAVVDKFSELALRMQAQTASWDFSDWLGFAGLVAVIAASLIGAWSAWYTTRRAGRQKVADARLKWSDQYQQINLDLHENLLRLDRYWSLKRNTVVSRRIGITAKRQAISILLMVNPNSGDRYAADEAAMQRLVLERMSRVGLVIDMEWVEAHRPVMKNNWKRVKNEF